MNGAVEQPLSEKEKQEMAAAAMLLETEIDKLVLKSLFRLLHMGVDGPRGLDIYDGGDIDWYRTRDNLETELSALLDTETKVKIRNAFASASTNIT